MIIQIIFQSGGEYYNTPSSLDGLKLITAIFSGLTLLLAFKIYKNWDVKKHFKKMQLDTVFDLVSEIEKSKVIISIYAGKDPINIPARLSEVHRLVDDIVYHEVLNHKHTTMSQGILYEMTFVKYVSNPFLPAQIAAAINTLYRLTFTSPGKDSTIDKNDYVRLCLPSEKHEAEPYIHPLLRIKNYEYSSIGAYFKQIIVIKDTILKWLDQFDAADLNINLIHEPKK